MRLPRTSHWRSRRLPARYVLLTFAYVVSLSAIVGGCNLLDRQSSQISYVNLVRFDGISYLANSFVEPDVLDLDDLGSIHATVQFQIAGNVSDASYRVKDRDATLLASGTPLYVVNGYAPTTRLAAQTSDGVVVFEADMNPSATTGADLLDLSGKVAAISINSDFDGITELARVEEPSDIARLVMMVLEAPVDQSRQANDGERVFIAFHLTDGTLVSRSYWLESGELSRGIRVPADFRDTVEQAISIT